MNYKFISPTRKAMFADMAVKIEGHILAIDGLEKAKAKLVAEDRAEFDAAFKRREAARVRRWRIRTKLGLVGAA